MIYINPLDANVVSSIEIHFKNIRCYINKKIGGFRCGDQTCKICSSRIKQIIINAKIRDYLLDPINLELLITSSPKDIEKINEEFWIEMFPALDFENDLIGYFDKKNISKKTKSPKKTFSKLLFENYINDINEAINYDWFSNKDNLYYSAYELAINLDRNACTYCNRIYTSTIINKDLKKVIRPTLDHWFPQSTYPLLALSFYNLIPSCSNCNSSVKGATNFNLNDHIHPYVDEKQNEEFIFKFRYNAKLDTYRIYLQDTEVLNSKARNTLKEMYIDEMYNSHQSELRDLLKIKKNYSKSYIESIEKLFGNKLAKEEVYRILFGVEFDSKDFHKLPLSKFKRDILKDLDII